MIQIADTYTKSIQNCCTQPVSPPAVEAISYQKATGSSLQQPTRTQFEVEDKINVQQFEHRPDEV